jgi:hypothetical protein
VLNTVVLEQVTTAMRIDIRDINMARSRGGKEGVLIIPEIPVGPYILLDGSTGSVNAFRQSARISAQVRGLAHAGAISYPLR